MGKISRVVRTRFWEILLSMCAAMYSIIYLLLHMTILGRGEKVRDFIARQWAMDRGLL